MLAAYCMSARQLVRRKEIGLAINTGQRAGCVGLAARIVGRIIRCSTSGDVAQLVRAPDCRSGGCGFESRRPRFVHQIAPSNSTAQGRDSRRIAAFVVYFLGFIPLPLVRRFATKCLPIIGKKCRCRAKGNGLFEVRANLWFSLLVHFSTPVVISTSARCLPKMRWHLLPLLPDTGGSAVQFSLSSGVLPSLCS